jgi:glutamyl-tRNA reductase
MEDAKEFYLLGVSFRTAAAAVREAWHFSASDAQALLRRAADAWPEWEAAVLSTCNRTEIYLAAPAKAQGVKCWLALLHTSRPDLPALGGRCRRYARRGWSAADHLFRVACGLESAILGDVQVLSQVKAAWSLAAEAGTLGKFLQQTFRQAVTLGRRARTETAISQGRAGIGSAVADWLAPRLGPSASGRTVRLVLLGAGEAARDVAHQLSKRRLGELCFLNRTETRSIELARCYAGRAKPWEALAESLAEADVVIAATAAPRPILGRALLEDVMRHRLSRPLLIVDAGLPRNVEPGSPVEVIDVDALREQQAEAWRQRQAAVPAVEALVREEVRAWQQWRAALPLEGLIKLLYQEADQRCRVAAQQLAAAGPLSREQAEYVVSRSVRQMLHRHVSSLRGWAGQTPAANLRTEDRTH